MIAPSSMTALSFLASTLVAFAPSTIAFQPVPTPLLRSNDYYSPQARPSLPLRKMTVEVLQEAATTVESFDLLSQMDTFWQTCPYTAAALVCGVKASAADLLAQQQAAPEVSPPTTQAWMENRDSPLDVKRNLAFVMYGSLYQGITHEYVFNHLYPVWFGTGCTMEIVAIKVAFNLLIQTTLVTLPVAYICKALFMTNDDDDKGETSTPLDNALGKYWKDIQYQGLLWKCFALWGPVQCLTFSVVPEHLRVTFIAVVSFFWLIILSSISSNEMVEEAETTR